MNLCYLDFETLSEIDLKEVGAYLYAIHESTDILCLAFAPTSGEVIRVTHSMLLLGEAWFPEVRKLKEYASDPFMTFVAHNAGFEQMIWEHVMVKRYGFPPIDRKRWKCTMAKALAHSLPGSLDGAAKMMKCVNQKMQEGKSLLRKLSRPRKKEGKPWWTPEDAPLDFERLYEYCAQDVETMRELDGKLRDLHWRELIVWQMDQRINQEGIHIDRLLVAKAQEFEAKVKDYMISKFQWLTGLSSPLQVAATLAFIASTYGVVMPDMQAATVDQYLESEIPEDVRTILLARQACSKTSLAKFKAIMNRTDKNGVIRDSFKYHGAHTGRWSGMGWQPHNLTRPKFDVNTACSIMLDFDFENWQFFYPDMMGALTSTLRGAIVPGEGERFLGGDLAQMEARIVAWCAGDEEKLDLFRQGIDMYCRAATTIYGYEVTKKMSERQTGKVSELALGYQGGITAYGKMARAYKVDLAIMYDQIFGKASRQEQEEAERSWARHFKKSKGLPGMSREAGLVADIIKQRWRKANVHIVRFWDELNNAACMAVLTKQPVKCGKVTWFVHERFLFCKLPSGRCLAYPYPVVTESGNGRFTLSYMNARTGRESTYGGKLAENIVQAIQRDLLVEAMIRLEKKYKVCLHVHDELVSPVKFGVGSLEEYTTIMKVVEPHHEGIPVNVSGWEGVRFGKAA